MKLGPYEVQDEIGRGGMGVVFRARGPDGRVVAIKLLGHGGTRERFDRERRLQAELAEEDGFVPFLESGDAREGPWLAMPLLHGGTLRARLADEEGLEAAAVERIGIALARALARAHARGIVHRDLKPENVLFTASGEPLIADLGLAKHFAPDARTLAISRGGDLRGTIGYMAPEQAFDSKVVDDKADVFSLGAILQELVTGRPAFVADSPISLLAKVEAGEREPFDRSRVPPWLAGAIDAALARDPKRRPTAEELARALEERRVLDAPPPPRKKPRVWPIALAALAVAAAAALAVLAAARDPGEGARRLELARDELARGRLGAALDEAVAADRAGAVASVVHPLLLRIHEVASETSDWACERQAWLALEQRGAVTPRAADEHLAAAVLQDARRPSPREVDDLARRSRSDLEGPPLSRAVAAALDRAPSLAQLERLLVEKKLPAPPAVRAGLARRVLDEHARLAAKLPGLDELLAHVPIGENDIAATHLAAFVPVGHALGLARRIDPSIEPFPPEALRFLALARVVGGRLAARRELGHEALWDQVFALDPDHPTRLFLRARIAGNSVVDGDLAPLDERVETFVAALERAPRSVATALLAEDLLSDLGIFFAGDERRERNLRLLAVAGDREEAGRAANAAIEGDQTRLMAIRKARQNRRPELVELAR